MLVFETKCKIVAVTEDIEDFNGYKYKVCKADIADTKEFPFLVPIKQDVQEGDCLEVQKCVLTHIGKDNLVIRADVFTKVDEESYTPLEEFYVGVNGKVFKTERSVTTKVGPARMPIIKATIVPYDEHNRSFKILLVGMCSSAALIENMISGSFINMRGVIKPMYRNSDKYQINIRSFEYVKERGETKQ